MRDEQQPPGDGYADIIDESIDDLNERGDLRSAGLDKKPSARRVRKSLPFGLMLLGTFALFSVAVFAYLNMSAPRNVVSRAEADSAVLEAVLVATDEGRQRDTVHDILRSLTSIAPTDGKSRSAILQRFESYLAEAVPSKSPVSAQDQPEVAE